MLTKKTTTESLVKGGVVYSRAELPELPAAEQMLEIIDEAEQAGRLACSRACKVECATVDLTGTQNDQALDLRVECKMVVCLKTGVEVAITSFSSQVL